jgi:hypothetical protein
VKKARESRRMQPYACSARRRGRYSIAAPKRVMMRSMTAGFLLPRRSSSVFFLDSLSPARRGTAAQLAHSCLLQRCPFDAPPRILPRSIGVNTDCSPVFSPSLLASFAVTTPTPSPRRSFCSLSLILSLQRRTSSRRPFSSSSPLSRPLPGTPGSSAREHGRIRLGRCSGRGGGSLGRSLLSSLSVRESLLACSE